MKFVRNRFSGDGAGCTDLQRASPVRFELGVGSVFAQRSSVFAVTPAQHVGPGSLPWCEGNYTATLPVPKHPELNLTGDFDLAEGQ